MSNRLESSMRLPLFPDPAFANRAGMAYNLSRARAEQVIALGESFVQLWRSTAGVIGELGRAIDCARMANALLALDDAALAQRGLARSDIPALVWRKMVPGGNV